jgi:hypothetical protein
MSAPNNLCHGKYMMCLINRPQQHALNSLITWKDHWGLRSSGLLRSVCWFWPLKMEVCPKSPSTTTNIRCVTTQKSEDPIYNEAWNVEVTFTWASILCVRWKQLQTSGKVTEKRRNGRDRLFYQSDFKSPVFVHSDMDKQSLLTAVRLAWECGHETHLEYGSLFSCEGGETFHSTGPPLCAVTKTTSYKVV